MIHILGDTPRDVELIRQAVHGAVQIIDAAGEIPADDGEIDCVIVTCPSRLLSARIELLREIERKLPLIPVILVTDRETSVAPLLSDVRVSALVWFDELQSRLQLRIEEVRDTAALSRLAGLMRRSIGQPALRAALVHSLSKARSTPIQSVQELAGAVGRSPATLSQQYRAHNGRATLSRFLSALLVLRAHQLRLFGTSWENVSGQLGVTRQTLYRKCRNWLDCTLNEMELIAPDLLLASFTSEYVHPLLEEAAPEAAGESPQSGQAEGITVDFRPPAVTSVSE